MIQYGPTLPPSVAAHAAWEPATLPASRGVASEAEVAQRRMPVRAAAERPAVLALALPDRQVVDAGEAQPHQAVLVELPVLVAVAAEPVAAVVMPLVGEAHCDAVVVKRPDLLDQPVVELLGPFAGQERLDLIAALDEFGAVAPAAVDRIGLRDPGRVAAVPGVLGPARLLRGGRGIERRKRRTVHGGISEWDGQNARRPQFGRWLGRSKSHERDDRARVLNAWNDLDFLVDEMSDVDAVVDIDLDQEVELARGRIDFRRHFGIGEPVCHLVGLAELAFDLDEERDHGTSGANPAKSLASGKASV